MTPKTFSLLASLLVSMFLSACSDDPTEPDSTGGCCSAGSCTITTEAGCSGAWTADTDCDPGPCPQPDGACCTTDGSCSVTTDANCSGDWQGADKECDPNDCLQPSGTCCSEGGKCSVTLKADCDATWTMFASCDPNPCSQPGACCDSAGGCTVAPEEHCNTAEGTWTPEVGCQPNPCAQPTGSCCAPDDSCSLTLDADCNDTWTASGDCAPNLCRSIGACCFCDGTCTLTDEGNCNQLGGEYAGEGTDCKPSGCDPSFGACCSNDGECQIVCIKDCIDDFVGGACDPNPCEQPSGSCCDSNGTCSVTFESGCGKNDVWTEDQVCDPIPCEQLGSCCGSDGACSVRFGSACSGDSDWTQNGVCNPNPCDQPTGACCVDAGCGVTTQAECGGHWTGANTDCDPACGGGPKLSGFSQVPAGQFEMGDGTNSCSVDTRMVTLTRTFYLGQTEVTNQQFATKLQWALERGYISADLYSVSDSLDGSTEVLLHLESWHCRISFDGNSFHVDEGMDNHPVVEVTWYGAAAYCDWLSLQEGLSRAYDHTTWECNGGDPYGASGYRLPTDAEREYAAQYDDERLYPWGGGFANHNQANYGDRLDRTTVVGSYPAAPAELELFDMAGNVWEWCDDHWYCYLGYGPETDPWTDRTGSVRAFGGGSYDTTSQWIRCASRGGASTTDSRWDIGFRVARTVGP